MAPVGIVEMASRQAGREPSQDPHEPLGVETVLTWSSGR